MKSPGPLQLHPDPPDWSGLLGHQGGWDEILLVVGPLALVAGLLWLANRRVSAQLEASERVGAGDAQASGGATEAPGEIDGSQGAERPS